MRTQKYFNDITPRDLDILNILWNNKKAMIASEIVSCDPTLTINTVQSVLRKLLKKKMIKIDDIVYSGTVLCRSYVPAITANDFAIFQMTTEFKHLNHDVSKAGLVAALLETETDPAKSLEEVEQLQSMLEEYKKKLKK